MRRNYRGFEFVKTGRQSWDWRGNFNGRYRWGTLAELRADADAVLAGFALPVNKPAFA